MRPLRSYSTQDVGRCFWTRWLGVVSVVSLLGAVALVVVPGAAEAIWLVGVLLNVLATVVLGGALAWTRSLRDLVWGLPAGSVIVVAGIDLGLLSELRRNAGSLLLFDVVGVVVAACGLCVLLAAGAFVGAAASWACETVRTR